LGGIDFRRLLLLENEGWNESITKLMGEFVEYPKPIPKSRQRTPAVEDWNNKVGM
jgi:hypothetical protein